MGQKKIDVVETFSLPLLMPHYQQAALPACNILFLLCLRIAGHDTLLDSALTMPFTTSLMSHLISGKLTRNGTSNHNWMFAKTDPLEIWYSVAVPGAFKISLLRPGKGWTESHLFVSTNSAIGSLWIQLISLTPMFCLPMVIPHWILLANSDIFWGYLS